MMTSPQQKWLSLKQRNYFQSMKLFVDRCSLLLLISEPQVMMLEVDFMTTEGRFDEALSQIEEILSLSLMATMRSLTSSKLTHLHTRSFSHSTSRLSVMVAQALLHFQIAQQDHSQAEAMQGHALLQVHSLPSLPSPPPSLALPCLHWFEQQVDEIYATAIALDPHGILT
jgi:hypothetical protein